MGKRASEREMELTCLVMCYRSVAFFFCGCDDDDGDDDDERELFLSRVFFSYLIQSLSFHTLHFICPHPTVDTLSFTLSYSVPFHSKFIPI